MGVEDTPDTHSTQQFGSQLDPSLARYFVDFDDVIESLKLVFAGEEADYRHDPPKITKFGDPLMNKVGIGKVLAKLKVIHKGIPMSNYEKHTPYIFTRFQTYTIAKEVFVHMNNYDIKSTDDANKIIEMVMVALFSVYNRPVGGGERNFIKAYAKEKVVIGPPQKKGFGLT